jgi:hypothetical protein
MRLFMKSAAVLALLATSTMAHGEGASACLSEAEAAAVFDYALPEMLDSMAKKCSPTLPKDAFLATHAGQYVSRYRASAAGKWGLAKAAFLKLAGPDDKADKILAAVPDDALKSVVTAAMGAAVTGDVKTAECPRIDKLIAALAPLPAQNVSQIIVQILALEGGKPGKSSDLRICEA